MLAWFANSPSGCEHGTLEYKTMGVTSTAFARCAHESGVRQTVLAIQDARESSKPITIKSTSNNSVQTQDAKRASL